MPGKHAGRSPAFEPRAPDPNRRSLGVREEPAIPFIELLSLFKLIGRSGEGFAEESPAMYGPESGVRRVGKKGKAGCIFVRRGAAYLRDTVWAARHGTALGGLGWPGSLRAEEETAGGGKGAFASRDRRSHCERGKASVTAAFAASRAHGLSLGDWAGFGRGGRRRPCAARAVSQFQTTNFPETRKAFPTGRGRRVVRGRGTGGRQRFSAGTGLLAPSADGANCAPCPRGVPRTAAGASEDDERAREGRGARMTAASLKFLGWPTMLLYALSNLQWQQLPSPAEQALSAAGGKAAVTSANETLFHEVLSCIALLCQKFPAEAATEFKRPIHWQTAVRPQSFATSEGFTVNLKWGREKKTLSLSASLSLFRRFSAI
ncbi:MAG: hypothetical protein BJ554DRAFT_7066 [Olpidium bornovanus]|uniref:Uncharacterized protein n=1 Tax=Olpidium bornovanus TaxID=278681 RepID=A0A8H8DJL5_9FUNG|nr:MAG: hypothetical protein BJ554DRAFT_7066 [Olpidium bornovanus]